MPDLSWIEWGAVASVLLVITAVAWRFRPTLLHLRSLITEIVGIVVLLSGGFLYAVAVPQWLRVQDELTQLPDRSGLSDQVQTLYTLYFGAISLMMLGGLLTVFGIFGRMASRKRKEYAVSSSPPESHASFIGRVATKGADAGGRDHGELS